MLIVLHFIRFNRRFDRSDSVLFIFCFVRDELENYSSLMMIHININVYLVWRLSNTIFIKFNGLLYFISIIYVEVKWKPAFRVHNLPIYLFNSAVNIVENQSGSYFEINFQSNELIANKPHKSKHSCYDVPPHIVLMAEPTINFRELGISWSTNREHSWLRPSHTN